MKDHMNKGIDELNSMNKRVMKTKVFEETTIRLKDINLINEINIEILGNENYEGMEEIKVVNIGITLLQLIIYINKLIRILKTQLEFF